MPYSRWIFVLFLCCCELFAASAIAQDKPVFGDFNPESITDIDLNDYPILPSMTERTLALYAQASANERDMAMFSKIGDSMTLSPSFLVGFGIGQYDLGIYSDLQATVDYFNASDDNPFSRKNYATALGLSTAAALDAVWSDPDCDARESPLTCELRYSRSLWALTMFGTNDVMSFDEATFDSFYRTVVLEILEAGVIPILYTFPVRPEEPAKSEQFNRIIVRIALDYDLPMINLAIALENLENKGVDPEDTLHLTTPDEPSDVATFNDITLQYGYTVRNLVTLQALNQLIEQAQEMLAHE